MEEAGIIRHSDSPWASPLHMVPKPDGSWRPWGNYRHLNNMTKPDRYPLPNIRDFTNNLKHCTVFSKLDLVKGYHQVPMNSEDICKTAIVTPFDLFEFLSMPFGLNNAAQTFQRLMDRIFKGLPFVFIYLDDILVASRGWGLHLKHLRVVLELLVQNGLVINLEKCRFALPEIDYLGHKITATGIVPLHRHVEALLQQPRPQDVCSLQRFLGMVNFYRRFLPGIAKILRPLTDAFLSRVFQQQSVPLSCSTVGLRGSEFQQLSRVIEELNSPPPCGQPSVPCWVSSTIKPQLSIHRPMGWWRDSTDSLKTLYELSWQLLIGTIIYLGFSWVSILLRERIWPLLLQRLFMVQIWSSLISSYRVKILIQSSSTRILKAQSQVFVQCLLVTTLPKFQCFLSRFQYLWQLVPWFWFAEMDTFPIYLLCMKDLIKF